MEVPLLEKIKKKVVLILRAKLDKNVDLSDQNISKEVVMMELNRQILENLYLVCQVPFQIWIHCNIIGSVHASAS